MIGLKNYVLLAGLFALLSCASFQQSLEKENKFYISFGDCFNNDTVTIYVNDSLLFQNRVFESGFSTGKVPNTSIMYENGYLSAKHENEQRKVKAEIDDDVRITIHINSRDSTFALSLKRGRNMVIDACQAKVKVNQYKNPVTFE